MSWSVAIIGGTSIGETLTGADYRPVHIPTRWGLVRAATTAEGILAIRRHGSAHRLPPHRVNYRANAAALALAGVRFCLASAAVGSLKADWEPGTLVVCSDLIDLSFRPTWQTDEVVHVDFSSPFDAMARQALLANATEVGTPAKEGGTYVCVAGPRYETPAEIDFFRRIGGDLVGMTAGTEAIVMKEAGIGYGLLAVVTNLAAGIQPAPLLHTEVEANMNMVREGVRSILMKAALSLAKS